MPERYRRAPTFGANSFAGTAAEVDYRWRTG
ncbi:hypothetical protein ABIC28_003740 [Rhodococcus sp. PvR044]|nr:hypothetical protein [Rhodococcus sp. PvR099]